MENIGNQIVENWSRMIDSPIAVNKKQGFLLNNGMRILFAFNDLKLSNRAIEILRRLRK